MAFQTKTFLSIVASMVNRMRVSTNQITDYNVGSVARTLVEAPAQEIDELYQQMLNGLIEGIQTSVFTSFNFPALGATAATGLIRVVISVQSAAVLIPATTLITRVDGSMSYIVSSDITIPIGQSFVDVPVAAQVVDVAGNMDAGTQLTLGIPIAGFVSASNLAPFVNGSPPETPEQHKTRFNAYIQTLSRGTSASLLYALTRLTFLQDALGNVLERVATANIDEPYKSDPAQPVGLVNIYIHNGVGGTSSALVARANAVLQGYVDQNGNNIPGYIAAGVHMVLFVASEQSLDVSGMLTIASPFDQGVVVAAVTSVLFTYIQGIPVGLPYLPAVANELVMQVDGVTNWVPSSPANYIPVTFNTKLTPGSFVILGWFASDITITFHTGGVLS